MSRVEYYSTRGSRGFSFEQAIFTGIAPDGGLFVPGKIPDLRKEDLVAWVNLSYKEVFVKIVSQFVSEDELPVSVLSQIADEAWLCFESPSVIPIESFQAKEESPLRCSFHVAEMFHGPTLSFKDLSMQFLGRMMEYFLQKSGKTVTIAAATSGDTGSAAMSALNGRSIIECFILFPGNNRISPQQELQMTKMVGPNLHVFVSETLGSDELDVVMRSCLDDQEFKKEHSMCTINSFNWGRVMCQIVNFVYLYCQILKKTDMGNTESLPVVQFVVPSGGMGNAAAGYFAHTMGLPIKLVACTNENDVIAQIIKLNEAKRQKTIVTISPSLDIQVPYNIERIIFVAMQLQGDGLYNKEIIRTDVPTHIVAQLTNGETIHIEENVHRTISNAFASFQSNESDILSCIRDIHAEFGYILDPHSAIAVRALYKSNHELDSIFQSDSHVICMATAHPAKFLSTMKRAIPNVDVSIPHHLARYMKSTETGDVTHVSSDQDCAALLREKITICHRQMLLRLSEGQ